jgi:hypothetical protein
MTGSASIGRKMVKAGTAVGSPFQFGHQDGDRMCSHTRAKRK